MPIGTVVDVEPDAAMCVHPCLGPLTIRTGCGAALTNSFAVVPLTSMRMAAHSPGIKSCGYSPGSDRGGQRAAATYRHAKMNDVDPQA
jgi:hypothetical protein